MTSNVVDQYFRPLVQSDCARPKGVYPLAGGRLWFSHAERITRNGPSTVVLASDIPADILENLTVTRPPISGLSFDDPLIMGILNVTPDSFSDGGQHKIPALAQNHAQQMLRDGADIIDIGGESTRPGATTVSPEVETARILPVITALRRALKAPISIDTRKLAVAQAAHLAGADIVNDVSGFTYDKGLAPYCAHHAIPVCVMHAQGDPETMHQNPHYENVLLDVYDFLAAQIIMLGDAGIARANIIIDPGIGFGKTLAHNLLLLNRISLFHGLGCPILLGVSRKGFIRTIGGAENPAERAPGSIAVGLAALAQGVQILRVHDVAETRQAINLWQAVSKGLV